MTCCLSDILFKLEFQTYSYQMQTKRQNKSVLEFLLYYILKNHMFKLIFLPRITFNKIVIFNTTNIYFKFILCFNKYGKFKREEKAGDTFVFVQPADTASVVVGFQ